MSIGHDIFADKQLRLVITENSTDKNCGCIDLFDFELRHKRAGVGIIINKDFRSKGFAKESLELMIDYAKKTLGLHQLYCNIQEDNFISIKLFESLGFIKQGTKIQWEWYENKFADVFFYQLIFN